MVKGRDERQEARFARCLMGVERARRFGKRQKGEKLNKWCDRPKAHQDEIIAPAPLEAIWGELSHAIRRLSRAESRRTPIDPNCPASRGPALLA